MGYILASSIFGMLGTRRDKHFRKQSFIISGPAPYMVRAFLAGLITAAASAHLPAASDRTIDQFVHEGWTAKEGARGSVVALAQTVDGYLWIGTDRGLYRFDGVSFEQYQPRSGSAFQSLNISALLAPPNGDLWIGYREGGVSLLHDGRNTNFGLAEGFPQGRVITLVQDREGTLWAATLAGLARFEKERWHRIGMDWNCPCEIANSVYVDRRGTLWVGAENTVLFLPPGARAFQPTGDRVGQIRQFAESRDGTLWMAETVRSVRPVPLAGRLESWTEPEIQVGSAAILFDDDGSLWITTLGDGMRRVPAPDTLPDKKFKELSAEVESFTAKDGLTSDYVTSILKDREGNIWVGTSSGLDRFRKGALVPVFIPSKFGRKVIISGTRGDIWVGTPSSAVGRLRENVFKIEGNYSIVNGFRDPAGVIWMLHMDRLAGRPRGFSILRLENERFDLTPAKLPGSEALSDAVLARDGTGRLWFSAGRNYVVYQEHGKWTQVELPAGFAEQAAIAAYTDPAGRVWFGFVNNGVLMFDGVKAHSFTSGSGVLVGSVRAIQAGGGHLWIGGGWGLELLAGDRFRPILSAAPQGFGGVSGIVVTSDGSLWLSEYRGAVHIPASEISKALNQPGYRVQCEVFDVHDGLPGEIQEVPPYPTAIQGIDGRVWFASSGGVASIDPAHIPRNIIPPPVSIRSVVANGRRYEPLDTERLPALTRDVQIDYSALSLAIPERVLFRYRLEGSDKDWRDAGTERRAFYTNLGPGPYRFRVIACNNDGVWNEAGAAWSFRIAPAFYQTRWFELLCILAFVLALTAAHRFRLRQSATALQARLDDRLAERTRIARDFHDTLLQTLQGSKIVADDALNHREDPSRMARALERLSQWLAQATVESRSVLTSLRRSIQDENALADAFEQACRECAGLNSLEFHVSVHGTAREAHPIVRDEVYRIGYEAIRNACLHSGATKLSVELDYREGLKLRVRDNGRGMDPNLAATGKAGHFGLLGMYERAARIKGKLTISSSPESGTEVVLVVLRDIFFPGSRFNARRGFGIIRRLGAGKDHSLK